MDNEVIVTDHPLADDCFIFENRDTQTDLTTPCVMRTKWCLNHLLLISYEIVKAT